MNKQQEWLVNYLLNNHNHYDTPELDNRVNGMSADQLIKVLDIVRELRNELDKTPLGRELN